MITPAKAITSLSLFVITVITIALANNHRYPTNVLAGENTVGTWLSGMLLVVSATLSLNTSMRRGWWPWLPLTLFFMILALDERFMFHEQAKERIILALGHTQKTSTLLYELPVILGTGIGVIVAHRLWKIFTPAGRALLLAATLFGTASVTIDVLAAGVLWEDSFKLLAELLIACALIVETTLPLASETH